MSNSSKERRSWGITQLTDQCLLLFKTSMGKRELWLFWVFNDIRNLCSQQVNRWDVILLLVHRQQPLFPGGCAGFSILCHWVLTLETRSNHFSTTAYFFFSLFLLIKQLGLPVASRRATLKSHQPSQELGPGDPLQCCTKPWVQTAPRRGPDASGRCRIPPQREQPVLRSQCRPWRGGTASAERLNVQVQQSRPPLCRHLTCPGWRKGTDTSLQRSPDPTAKFPHMNFSYRKKRQSHDAQPVHVLTKFFTLSLH